LPVLVLQRGIGIAVAILFAQNIVIGIAILFISIVNKPVFCLFVFVKMYHYSQH